jgi:tetratricopeptide (TPR) repeat protein
MQRTVLATPILALAVAGLAVPALAQKSTTTTARSEGASAAAETLENDALARLAAWKTNAARQLLDRKREQLGETPQFAVAKGFLQAQDGAPDEALSTLAQAAAALPKDPAPAYLRGEVLYSWKDRLADAQSAWKDARARAEAVLKTSPDDPRARYYLGAALVRLQAYGDARTALDAALSGGFDPVLVSYQRGLSFAFSKQWEAAIQAFDDVLSRDDRFAYAYYFRGLSQKQRGRTDKMLNDLDRFVALASNAPDADTAKALLSAAGR